MTIADLAKNPNSFIWWFPDYVEAERVSDTSFKLVSVKGDAKLHLDSGQVDGLVLMSKVKHIIGDGLSWPDKIIVPVFKQDGLYESKNKEQVETGERFSIIGTDKEADTIVKN